MKTPWRVAGFILLAAVSSAALTAVEYRLLWGYWGRTPSMVFEQLTVNSIRGVSSLGYRLLNDDEVEPLILEPGVARDPDKLCGDLGLSACEAGEAVTAVFASARQPIAAVLPDVNDQTWRDVRRKLLEDARGLNAPRGEPTGGLAIEFIADAHYVWVAYFTSEIAYDWHNKVQALYKVDSNGPTLQDRRAYRYQVAGLESTRSSFVWSCNFIVMLIAGAARWLRQAKQRSMRVVGTVAAYALVAVALGFLSLVSWFLHYEDPWMLVLATSAILLILAGRQALVFPRSTP